MRDDDDIYEPFEGEIISVSVEEIEDYKPFKEQEYLLKHDPVVIEERKELRRQGIDAVHMKVIPVIVNFGRAVYHQQHQSERKR